MQRRLVVEQEVEHEGWFGWTVQLRAESMKMRLGGRERAVSNFLLRPPWSWGFPLKSKGDTEGFHGGHRQVSFEKDHSLNGRQDRDKGMYLHLMTYTVIGTFRSYLLLVSSQLDHVDGENALRCGMGWLCQDFPWRGCDTGSVERQENRGREGGDS